MAALQGSDLFVSRPAFGGLRLSPNLFRTRTIACQAELLTSGWRCRGSWRMGGTVKTIANLPAIRACRPAWNKGRVVGQKRPLMPMHLWASCVRLEIAENNRDLTLFNLAIGSKLRGCDLVKLKVANIYAPRQVKERASIVQSKTQRPVRFEITEGTRKSLLRWMEETLMLGFPLAWSVSRTAAYFEPAICAACP